MIINQQKKRITFTEKAESALTDILNKYGLRESDEQIIKKDEEDKLSYECAIINFARKLSEDESAEKNLISALQKELGIPQTTTEKIVKDIKEKVIPLMESVPEEELEKQSETDEIKEELPFAGINPPIGLENMTKQDTKITPVPKRPPISETTEKTPIKELKRSSKRQKQDTYRESAE